MTKKNRRKSQLTATEDNRKSEMNSTGEWLLDVELSDVETGNYCFCPLHGGEAVIGMTVLADEPPGEFVGLFHGMGPEALNEWIDQNQSKVEEIKTKWKK